MEYFNNWTWQDYLVAAALIMAASFLWRTRIAPRLRREPQGCDSCAAHPSSKASNSNSSKTQTVKLTAEQAKRMRDEM